MYEIVSGFVLVTLQNNEMVFPMLAFVDEGISCTSGITVLYVNGHLLLLLLHNFIHYWCNLSYQLLAK